MTDSLSTLEDMVWRPLAEEKSPTAERIRELINQVRVLPIGDFESISDEDAEKLARKFEERVSITQSLGTTLVERGHEPWLDAAKEDINPFYWDRYRRHLIQDGLPPAAVTTLDDVTDRVLNLMQDPNRGGSWDRRGLVVGHVQSGKTANYTGLMCKAADAGYRLIIVIAGIHNNLRGQTQRRIDEGFVGRDSARLLSGQTDMFVGVGEIDNTRRPVTLTNTARDFNKNTATSAGIPIQNLSEPAVFVIKKNSNTLRNLIEWLREYGPEGNKQRISEPMLLIDDEADNASINIRHREGETSTINRQIRELLALFEKSCYVGYTATPFANIFIDPDTDNEMLEHDLFPSSFIVSLDPPSNYFGPTDVFLRHDRRYIRPIDDNEDHIPLRHPIDLVVESLPRSLVDAVRIFILSRAIRLARGQSGQHSSMLVNVSRFVAVQSQIRNLVHVRLEDIRNSVRIHGALTQDEALRDTEIQSLHQMWRNEYGNAEFDWPDVQKQLHAAAAPIRVVEVNSRSAGTLDYSGNKQNGLSVIAVGGYSLSRGLTLEGLTTSYFMRNSKMYDTLMQMGRWFGYRPEYQDLCRIWMPEEAEGWYEHIADSIEELREELRRMEAAGATPQEFGLKVRSHPDTLIVTARNKMGTGQSLNLKISLASRLIETHTLLRGERERKHNLMAAESLAKALSESGHSIESADDTPFGFLIRSAPAKPILNFLIDFRNHDGSPHTSTEPLRRYIEERRNDELAEWDVLFASLRQKGNQTVEDTSLGRKILRQRRSEGPRKDAGTLLVSSRQRVSTRGIERIGLSDAQIFAAEQEYRDRLRKDGKSEDGGKPNYPDWIYRRRRTRPLLMVHLLDVIPKEPDESMGPVVAWGISFPPTEKEDDSVEYVVNTTWMRENYGTDVEEEMGGDSD